MNRPAFTTTLFLGCMIAASASLAGTDVVKCVDAAGHIVLTDQPCAGGSEILATPTLAPAPALAPAAAIEPMAAPAGPAFAAAAPAAVAPAAVAPAAVAPAAVRTVTVERYAATPREAPRSAWAAKKIQPAAPMSSDAATLRTARQNLQAMDQAAAQMRQRLAGLN
jgi:hypothetical protein